ncbi:hypothetical protein G6O69_04465 [Pseudenhygromyxa sp. WMMC2535]|uniref:hypothetical protein n=1 Tax=Pseudenhygromyxa sp. WMMC2535 TaxID=2712867 RepID=UPI00155658E4|nr:hypothetical protein [Pseudenhygromyxa sp. WMMC2535]NVB37072.1 hypothetical protein [Pseudenhygromyxa sp. WMMC2535]
MIRTAGRDWCRYIDGARMWPPGEPEAAVPVYAVEGGPPLGCRCFNAAEHDILDTQLPEDKLAELHAELAEAARNECHLLVPQGYAHNCYDEDSPDAPSLGVPTADGLSSDCFGSCAYANPPLGKDCPEDPDPWECNDDGGDDDVGGDELGDDDGDEETQRFDDLTQQITCQGDECTIVRDFAHALWTDPEQLLTDDARLIFNADHARFVLSHVRPGSLAHALGLRSGDIIETVNGHLIDGPEAGLVVYVDNEHAKTLTLGLTRDGQWIERRFIFSP